MATSLEEEKKKQQKKPKLVGALPINIKLPRKWIMIPEWAVRLTQIVHKT